MSLTATAPPVGVFVDCTQTPADVELLRLADQFNAAVAARDAETAQQVNGQLADLLAQPSVDTVTVRPLEDEEVAALQTAQADGLDQARAVKAGEVRAALAATDQWAARAVEEAAPMPAARIAYRQKLRALFPQIAAAADHAAVDAIAIPDPPAPPAA